MKFTLDTGPYGTANYRRDLRMVLIRRLLDLWTRKFAAALESKGNTRKKISCLLLIGVLYLFNKPFSIKSAFT